MITLNFCMKSKKPILKHISHNYLSGIKSCTDMDGNHQSNKFSENASVICRKGFEKVSDRVKVKRGLANMIRFSELQGRHELNAYLFHLRNKVPPGQFLVQDKCRGPFMDYKRLNKVDQGQASCNPKKQKLRIKREFNWKGNCFFSDSPMFDDRHPDQNKDS